MLTLVPGQPPTITPGNSRHPPGMMCLTHFEIDADELERLAKKYVRADEMKNLAFHLVKSKRELDAKVAELLPIQWETHAARLDLEKSTKEFHAAREADRARTVDGMVAIEQREAELAAKAVELATRESAVKVRSAELTEQERVHGQERSQLDAQQKQLATERAAHEKIAGPIQRKWEHLQRLAEIE